MNGQLSHELEVNVAASEVWELYNSPKFAKLVEEGLSIVDKIELVEGDGGVGTIFQIVFQPGVPGYPGYKEKYTKIDNENKVKEAEVVEGGYLEFGFNFYRIRFEIIEKAEDSCIIKSTIDYEVKEEAASNASIVTIEPFANIAEIVKTHLSKIN